MLVVGSQLAPAAQSVGAAQGAAPHAVPAQAYGAQAVCVPGVQVPAPLHIEAAVAVADAGSQEAGRQVVPGAYIAHRPVPSHVPVVAHVEAAMGGQVARGSAPPAGTSWQLPGLPETAHDQHGMQLADPQQTCSTQWPLMQVVPSVHAPPFGVRFVHEPFAHVSPGTQSPSAVHVVRHAAPEPQT